MEQNHSQGGNRMDTAEAYAKMQEANEIIQDFSIGQYALYLILFLIETAVVFWWSLNM